MERFPVTNEEYQALRSLFGCMSVFQVFRDRGIEKRMKRCGGWRWYRLAQVATDKAIDAFLKSIPANKLQSISRDLKNVKMDVYVDGVTGKRRHDRAFYVEEDTMNTIAGYACQGECTFCTKKGAAVKQCRLRKSLINVVPWDLKTLDGDGKCNLSGEAHMLTADDDLPFCRTMDELDEEWSDPRPQEVRW